MTSPHRTVKFAPGLTNVVWRDEPDGTRTMIDANIVEISLVGLDDPPWKILDE